MKLLYKSQKYKKHSLKIARKQLKRRLLRKKRDKHFYRSVYKKTSDDQRSLRIKRKYKQTVNAPSNLSFLEDPNSVVLFLTKIESILSNSKSLYVEMKFVEKIDYATITALFAILYTSRKKGIKIDGSMPGNPLARSILMKSGFIYTLFSDNPIVGHKYEFTANNQLFTLNDRDMNVVEEIVDSVSTVLAGEKCKIPGLYTTVGELMDNTITHAAENENERWWLSINCNHIDKKVEFVFIDYGIGIFTSLSRKSGKEKIKKIFDEVCKSFGVDAVERHLEAIVKRSAGEEFNLSDGHGEGIYGIYNSLQRGDLNSLYIISNNAYGDIANNRYIKLKRELKGTLYYWEICVNNIKKYDYINSK
ncbi:MAG: ATP-binding protein [Candidatus Paceibacterota bacterium]